MAEGDNDLCWRVGSGVLSARGDLILFIDADLSTPISQLDRIIEVLRREYDVAVGSRSGGEG
ncbi:glycosyltransferase [Candidatus Poribacteria bacterium]|nr:glycosyltransferase [Candidatus Poribacteria bacterium]